MAPRVSVELAGAGACLAAVLAGGVDAALEFAAGQGGQQKEAEGEAGHGVTTRPTHHT